MLKIAVCDDQKSELETLEALVRNYADENRLDAMVNTFSHPDDLMKACGKETFHIYLLDIVMPMIDGITLGMDIRRLDREAQIIFATTEPQYALEAYAANPINFLVKPVAREKLFKTLELAVSRLDLSVEKTVTVKTSEGLRVIPMSKISSCEYRNHSVSFTLMPAEVIRSRTLSMSFTDYIVVLLRDRRFIRTHASFVVNMRFVERFNKDSFILTGGVMVPISARYYPTVRDSYMDHVTSKDLL